MDIHLALNKVVVNLTALYQLGKQAHWNFAGPQFPQYHQLFEQLATAAYAEIDLLAEHCRYLGGSILYSPEQILALSEVGFVPERSPLDLYLSAMLNGFHTCKQLIVEADDIAIAMSSRETIQLLEGVLERFGKPVFLLQSCLGV